MSSAMSLQEAHLESSIESIFEFDALRRRGSFCGCTSSAWSGLLGAPPLLDGSSWGQWAGHLAFGWPEQAAEKVGGV